MAADYFQLRGLDAEIALLNSTVTDLENQLDLTQRRLTGGIGTEADVAQARTQLETVRAQRVDVGVARAQYEHAIGTIANLKLTNFSILSGSADGISPARRSSGKIHVQSPITTKVPTPPNTTAGTVPNQCAVMPDSNSPNWFDAPIKIMSTAFTRPRIASGVRICTRIARMTTLTMSQAPTSRSEMSDRMRLRDNPKTMVKMPKRRRRAA